MKILDVRIDNYSKKELLGKVKNFLADSKFHQIATINPEFVLESQNNIDFKQILNNCDLNIADGFGIKLAFWRYGKHLRCRMTGFRLMMEILQIANDQKLSVFLAARKDGLSSWQETRAAILKYFPKVNISGDNIDIKNTSYHLPNTACQILFCNFGAPHQELFINRQKDDTIRLTMGVGGSFDFLTKKIKRAPKFLRQLGLEWLWRIFQQKEFRLKRLRRVGRSVVIFPIKIIIN